jgi:co-chaperonin GroES (HSP10)
LYIPEKAQEALNEGLVVATGPGTVGKVRKERNILNFTLSV